MSRQIKAITLRAKYESDLSGFKSDLASIKSFRRNLEKMPLKIPIRLDLSDIHSQAKKAAAEIKKSITGAMSTIHAGGGGGSTSKGGIIIPASAMRQMNQFKETSKDAFKQIGNANQEAIKSFKQLEAGLVKVETFSKKAKGMVSTYVDTRPLEKFKQKLAEINKMNAPLIGSANGNSGNLAGALRKKQREIDAALGDNELTGRLKGHPAYLKAKGSLDRLEERIATLTGTQTTKNTRAARTARIDALKQSLFKVDEMTTGSISKAKGSGVGVAEELANKRMMIQKQLDTFADIKDSNAHRQAQKAMNSLAGSDIQSREAQSKRDAKEAERNARKMAAAKKADTMRRADSFIGKRDDAMNRNQQKLLKEESVAKRTPNRVDREAALNQVLDRRTSLLDQQIAQYRKLAEISKQKGHGEAAGKYTGAANRMQGAANQIHIDRTRRETDRILTESKTSLKRDLSNVQNQYRTRLEELKNQEVEARKYSNPKQRSAALQKVEASRAVAREEARLGLQKVSKSADHQGNSGLKQRADNAISGIDRQGVAGMRKMADATRASGHAFSFHSSSLLKNAATFTKWYIPAQAAMGAFAAMNQGITSAIDTQRTFKILDSVFRGTGEESKLLADQTLMLAAANGRSTQEAADASVAWARMGLTRTQILVAMESSMRAANVAEISTAEATAYLTANYKAFGQTIAEIPATLDYINSLSNKNAVAPKEIFEGLSRGAVIAKEAGITFQELAAIIATVSAETQRPGAEIGNAVKSLSTRLRRPATVKKLKDEFGYNVKDGEGDAKKMTQVLGELAAIYPTLNRMEKGRMEDMVAGSHQGNRFAVIMNNWTNILGAQAEAGLDANSAMRENAKILESVSAQLDSLSTSWTRLFHTLGEAGAFDTIRALLEGASKGVEDLGDSIQWVTTLGGILPKDNNPISRFAEKSSERFVKSGGFNALFLYRSAKDLINGELLAPENKSTHSISRTTSARRAEEVTGLRNRSSSIAAMSRQMKSLSASFGSDGFKPEKQIEQFDKSMNALTTAKDLPWGAAMANEARRNIRPLLVKGDVGAARAGLAGLSESLRGKSETESSTLASKTTGYVEDTRAALDAANQEIEKFNNQLAGSDDKGRQEEIQQNLAKTTDDVKALQDNLETLRKGFSLDVEDSFVDAMIDRMDRLIQDTETAAEVYGNLINSFANTGFSNLDATLASGAAAANRNMLRQMVEATEAENTVKDAEADREMRRLDAHNTLTDKEKNRFSDEKNVRDQSLSRFKQELSEIDEPTEEALRKIELERQASGIRMGYDDGRRFTAAGMSSYDIGRNEGERLTSRGFGILRDLEEDTNNPNLGDGDAVQDARELGGLTERMTQAKETYFSMEARINGIVAERANLESDITEEMRKQSEEASRRLAMASREDQLRSAGASAVLRNKGKSQYSMDEFQFFSSETRNAIQSFNPNTVKGLDDAEASRKERRDNLDQEFQGLAVSMRQFKSALAYLLPQAEDKGGKVFDLNNPLGKDAPTGGRATDLNKDEIRMNLNTGPITVNLDFGRHVQDIKSTLQTHLDAKLDAFRAEYRSFRNDTDPNTSPAGSAW